MLARAIGVRVASLPAVGRGATLHLTCRAAGQAPGPACGAACPGGAWMTVRTVRWATGYVAAVSIALIAAGLALSYVDRHLVPVSGWDFPDAFEEVTFMAVPAVGFVLASRRPGNRIGWLFLGAGMLLGLGFFCDRYGPRGLIAAPGSVPAARVAAWFVNWVWVVPAAGLAFLLLLFPTGRLSSRRWRPAAWFVAVVFALQIAAYVVRACRVWPDPYTAPGSGWYPGSHTALIILWPAAMLVGVAALVAAAIIPLALAPQVALSPAVASAAVSTLKVAFCLALLCFYAAIAIAILKYRLYEIDIVISKAVQYGTLAVFITIVYAGLVAGVGALAGDRYSPLLSALAAVVVAVAFQPARQRAAQLANRVVYGRRVSPYQVLSEFARRTGAERVVVWLRVGTELRAEAASDGAAADPLPVDGHQVPPLPDTDFSAPVV